jgi:hypothetical protein
VAANIWAIVLIWVLSLFSSFVFGVGFYVIISKTLDFIKDRKKKTEDMLLMPQNKPYKKSGKEVEEDEEIRNRKLREFEKLRSAIRSNSTRSNGEERKAYPDDNELSDDEQSEGREPVSLSTDRDTSRDQRSDGKEEYNTRKRIKLSE